MRRLVAILVLCLPGPAVSLIIIGHLRWALVAVGAVAGAYVAASLTYAAGVAGAWVFLAWVALSVTVNVSAVLATFILPIRTGQQWQTWWGYLLGTALCYAAVLLILELRRDVVEPYAIPSMGMAPTLVAGDYVLARKRAFGGSIAAGEVVVFTYPQDPDVVFIARVGATAGQSLEVRGGSLVVDGQELPREPAVVDPTLTDGDCDPLAGNAWTETRSGRRYPILTAADPGTRIPDFGPTVVPDGMFFAIGDNRDSSADSRVLGGVRVEDVLGVVSDRWFTVDPCTQAFRTGRVGPVP